MRCVIHIDIDCFYVQVDMLRLGLPAERPVAVTQKFLVVTCNYAARAAGVTKLMATEAAQQRCPDLLLVSGEDLTPYREASEAVFGTLCEVGPTQRLGLDEFFIDATAAAAARLEAEAEAEAGGAIAAHTPQWEERTHVHRATLGTTTAEALAGQTWSHRPMDLRAISISEALRATAAPPPPTAMAAATCTEGERLLRAGSRVAAAARRAVQQRTGLTCAAGIASSKLFAKLVGGLHKPDSQTALPEAEARAFLAPLPVRALPGVGAKAGPLDALHPLRCAAPPLDALHPP